MPWQSLNLLNSPIRRLGLSTKSACPIAQSARLSQSDGHPPENKYMLQPILSLDNSCREQDHLLRRGLCKPLQRLCQVVLDHDFIHEAVLRGHRLGAEPEFLQCLLFFAHDCRQNRAMKGKLKASAPACRRGRTLTALALFLLTHQKSKANKRTQMLLKRSQWWTHTQQAQTVASPMMRCAHGCLQ